MSLGTNFRSTFKNTSRKIQITYKTSPFSPIIHLNLQGSTVVLRHDQNQMNTFQESENESNRWTATSFHRNFLFALPVPVFVIDSGNNLIFANPAFLQNIGLPDKDLIGRRLWDFYPSDEYLNLKEACNQVFRDKTMAVTEFESAEEDSEFKVTLTWWDGYVAGAITEVTKNRQMHKSIQQELTDYRDLASALGKMVPEAMEKAHTDPLTGLANRRRANEITEVMFPALTRRGKVVSVIMLDIDHFKKFNDTYGHAEGDNVLRKVGQVMIDFADESETAARIGGEEFIVICPNLSAGSAVQRAGKLLEEIRAISGTATPVTGSCGVACSSDGNFDWNTTLDMADKALYAAKAGGRNQVVRWSPALHSDAA